MKVLDLNFTTIRASVATVARELEKTAAEKRIMFGPGFMNYYQQEDVIRQVFPSIPISDDQLDLPVDDKPVKIIDKD